MTALSVLCALALSLVLAHAAPLPARKVSDNKRVLITTDGSSYIVGIAFQTVNALNRALT